MKNDELRRKLKRKSLRHTRMELEIAREKGHGVNFTAYISVEEYEPKLIEEELQHAEVELNILYNIVQQIHDFEHHLDELYMQIDILHSLIRPRTWIQQQMTNHNVTSVEQLKGLL